MVRINTLLTRSDGSTLAPGILVCPAINTLPVVPKDDGLGGHIAIRKMFYGLNLFVSSTDYLAGRKPVSGDVVEFKRTWERSVSEAEHSSLMLDGSLASVWLKDYLESLLGVDTCEVFDPFV